MTDDSKNNGGQGPLAKRDMRDFRVSQLSKWDVHDMTVEGLELLRKIVNYRGGDRYMSHQVAAAGHLLRWTMWATDRADRHEPPKEKAFLDLFESPEAATRWLVENRDRLEKGLSSVTRPPMAHSVAQSAAAAAKEGSPDEAEQGREGEAHAEQQEDGR